MTNEINHQELEQKLDQISTLFYEKIFRHPWLSQVFSGVDQKFLTQQQTDFMLGAFGGPKKYSGRSPSDAHTHIFVSEDMWQEREQLLVITFEELQTPEWIKEKWLKIDEAFKNRIVMKSPRECVPRYATDELIIIENPQIKKVA